ncbi:Yqey-like protein-domain-containing protein [Xylariomycetidae sp. FL2044]|nr:Yqey-like protein-domain-containing protein [Xylariomycetidae sp. FL2044]
MSSRPVQRIGRSLLRARIASSTQPLPTITSSSSCLRTSARFYSSPPSDPPAPPLLQKLKGDLKTAMRAKDKARLTAIRSVLAATLNASKTASPVATDAQLVALLRKTQKASEDAGAEAAGAGREDLAEKEREQIRILDEYIAGSGVEEVGEDQLRTVVAGVVTAMTSEGEVQGKAKVGDVMRRLLAPGGPLEGKNVDKAELARIVKEITG